MELLADAAERQMTDRKIGVVRNSHLPVRDLQTGFGLATIKIPKVRAKTEFSVAPLDAREHERAQLPAEISSGEGEIGAA